MYGVKKISQKEIEPLMRSRGVKNYHLTFTNKQVNVEWIQKGSLYKETFNLKKS